MEKGLEITFTVPGRDGNRIVEALANLVGNEFQKEMEVHWRIFDVTLDKQRFFKICFTGRKVSRLHPIVEDRIKKRFDELAHYEKSELMRIYHKERKNQDFEVQNIQEKKEEYDLWQDEFWKYF